MREEDLDLLADHLGGALDSTPEGERVARLVATDPAWARAAARLSGAFDAVATDLQALPTPVLPDDVAVRLEAVLRTAGTPTGVLRTRAEPGSRAESGSPVGVPARPATEVRRPPRTANRRRRRAARWGAGLAVAAAAVGFAGFGLSNLDLGAADHADQGALSTSAEESPERAIAGPRLLTATGADYHRSGLPAQPPQQRPLGTDPQVTQDGDAGSPGGSDQPGLTTDERDTARAGTVPAALQHLMPLPQTCLSAVQEGYEQGVTTVDGVDYAHFEGAPALVIWVTTDTGESWVTVAGPQCGSPGAAADERHRTAVR